MRMNISAWAIRNPMPSIVLFAVLMVLGVFAFKTLPITKFPNIDVPIVAVTVTQGGAAPAELETQVTKKIEDAVAGLTGVKHIISSITDGASTTTVEFRLETNTDRAVNDVKDAVSRIRSELPRTVDEPITRRIEIEGAAILTYAVSAKTKSIEEISWHIDDTVIRRLQSSKGVASVTRVGGVTREIRVELDPARLNALGITAAEVNRQLRSTNVDLAGGRGDVGGQEQSIRTLAGARTLADLKDTQIWLSGGRKVRLADLGTIEDASAEARQFARLDGEPVVAFSIFRAKGSSDADVYKEVEKQVAQLRKDFPDYAVTAIDNTVRYTVGNFESAMKTLIEGSVLAVIVVLLFLRDWRATLIAALALPLSAIPTFFAISAMGFSLNLVSLLAITLATGVLVDDAIVEIENIVRHMRMGKSPYRAALEAADEIGLAVIAISLTIVAVFAPVSFMGGIAGQYFKQFGLTVAAAVIFSLLVARLITPLLAAYFLRDHAHDERGPGLIMRGYTRLVAWTVRHRWVTLALGLGIFYGSIQAMALLPKGFIPPIDEGRMMFAVELPPGSQLSDTQRVTDDIARRLKQKPEIASAFVNGGYMIGTGGSEVRKAVLTINLTHKSARQKSQKTMEAEVSDALRTTPDIRFWYIQPNGMRTFSMLVAGEDQAKVVDIAARLQSQMRGLSDLVANPVSSASLDRPEIQIRPRMELAAELGVTTDALSETIRVATIGDVGPNLAKFDAGDRLIPIRVQIAESSRADLQALETLRVGTLRGAVVPLAAIADVGFGRGPASIERYDRTRRVAVEADLVGTTALGAAVDAVLALPAAQNLPAGIVVRQAGDAEIMGEVFAGFATAMSAGLMMVFGVLVLLFASVLQPITILFSLPLSIGGVVAGLLAANMAFSMPVVIGFLMLMGIVTKNAIMLVDFAVERMAQGMSRAEAIVDAGAKRARPIVMTSIAMGAGMVPAALAFGDGGEFRAPMAVAVIGGLIASTFLSLLFVPSVFTIMDTVGNAIWWVFGRFVGPKDEPGDAAVAAAAATIVATTVESYGPHDFAKAAE
ncbi:MAG: efflux RND transporter permease subunit [Methylobacteriaceae bacterium]|nr:efflux RND transporter permease subunit [Methylobacteriaceae bacterium]